MRDEIKTLNEALYELSKLVGDTSRIEGAPKEAGDKGPVPIKDTGNNDHWREVKRDLSDVPRGYRWLVRKLGEGRGKKPVKGAQNYIIVCLEDAVELQGYSDVQIIASRQLDARQWDLLRRYGEFMDERDRAYNQIHVLQKQTFSLIGDSITHALSSGSNASLIAELSKSYSALLDDLTAAKDDNNTSKGIIHILNRIVSYVQLRKIKNWEELRNVPEMKKDIEAFFRWRDERDAPVPDAYRGTEGENDVNT